MPDLPHFDNPCLGRLVCLTGLPGRLHIGHWLEQLAPVSALQAHYETIVLLGDEPGSSPFGGIRQDDLYEALAGWLAAGLSPNESLIVRQSALPELARLQQALAPVSRELGLPESEQALAAATAYLGLQASHAPAPAAQRAAIDLAGALARRLRRPQTLPAPAWIALPAPPVPGLDGLPLHTGQANTIHLGDSEADTAARLPAAAGQRPAVLAAYARAVGCPPETGAGEIAERLNERLHSLRVKRQKWLAAPGELEGILRLGERRARPIVAESLATVLAVTGQGG